MKAILTPTSLALVAGALLVQEGFSASSVNILVTYRDATNTVNVGPTFESDQVKFSSSSSSTYLRKDPATGKSVVVYPVGTGSTNRALTMEEIKSGADAGDAECQMELAYFYDTGEAGFATDSVQAYKWATLAKAGKVAKADKTIQSLELFMKPAEIEQAKKAAAEFQTEAAKKKDPDAKGE